MKDGFAMDCGHQLDIRYSFHTKISDDLKILRKREREEERGREMNIEMGIRRWRSNCGFSRYAHFSRGDGIRNSRVWRDID